MANQEHLDILMKGVDVWNEWREENSHIKPDLSETNLIQVNLKGLDFREANLSGADLMGANLNQSNLSGANLVKAGLSGAELIKASLSGAELIKADLSGADLSQADLTRANLFEANFTEADLYGTQFIAAHLREANFKRATLCGAFLLYANLIGANLKEADLSGAHINGANLNGANLSQANLSGSYLSEVNFTQVNLTEANLKDCIVGRTIFGLTNLTTIKNIESVIVQDECVIDFQTLRDSESIPKEFLFKIGLPENYINYLPDFYDESPIRLFPVFLSHASKDKEFATKLYNALIKRKVRVWFDEKQLKMGDDIRKGIKGGINLYDKFILVCSKNSLKHSWWVDEEISRALKKKELLFKELGRHVDTIIPITLDDYLLDEWDGEMKENITRHKVGDFKDWENDAKFEKSVDKLVEALNVDRGDGSVPSFI